jgi:hypothetical protein
LSFPSKVQIANLGARYWSTIRGSTAANARIPALHPTDHVRLADDAFDVKRRIVPSETFTNLAELFEYNDNISVEYIKGNSAHNPITSTIRITLELTSFCFVTKSFMQKNHSA